MSARSTQDTPLWNTMRRSDFDASEPLTLFDIERDATAPVKTDKCGTPDLFSSLEQDSAIVDRALTPDLVNRRQFACGCLVTYTGPLGTMSDRLPCGQHDGSPVPSARAPQGDAAGDDWEAAFLATYPSVSANWPL